jgi:hypothetical protein
VGQTTERRTISGSFFVYFRSELLARYDRDRTHQEFFLVTPFAQQISELNELVNYEKHQSLLQK